MGEIADEEIDHFYDSWYDQDHIVWIREDIYFDDDRLEKLKENYLKGDFMK